MLVEAGVAFAFFRTFTFRASVLLRVVPKPRDHVGARSGRISLLLAALLLGSGVHAAEQAPATKTAQPRVLVLYSDERLLPASIVVDEAIRTTLAAGVPGGVEFHSEFLDPARFPGEAHELRQRDYLRDKYRQRPPSLVIAGGAPALNFLVKNRNDIFQEVPIVYCSVAGDRPELQFDEGIAGVPVFTGAGPTLELALRLHPHTRHVTLVWGSGTRDQEMTARFRETCGPLKIGSRSMY